MIGVQSIAMDPFPFTGNEYTIIQHGYHIATKIISHLFQPCRYCSMDEYFHTVVKGCPPLPSHAIQLAHQGIRFIKDKTEHAHNRYTVHTNERSACPKAYWSTQATHLIKLGLDSFVVWTNDIDFFAAEYAILWTLLVELPGIHVSDG